jgi:hypothetical protein
MGDAACKEPDAITYINKAITMGKPGNKKKKPGADYSGHFSW